MLNLAEELGSVSEVCKVMGVSRDTFYRYQELVEEDGVEILTVEEHESQPFTQAGSSDDWPQTISVSQTATND